MNTMALVGARPHHEVCCSQTGGAKNEAWTLRAVARAKEGDRHAIRYLYSRYSDTVRRYAMSLLRDGDAADDVVQTTFLKLLTKIDRYEPRDVPFEAWLLRVTRNAALDELRRRRANPCTPVLDHDAPVDDAATERLGTLRAALGRLPAAEREVLVLRHLVGLSSAEVAERLDCTEAMVHTLHHRGRASLRAALRQAGDEPRQRAGAAPRHDEQPHRRRAGSRRLVVEVMN